MVTYFLQSKSEEKVRIAEEEIISDNTEENKSKLNHINAQQVNISVTKNWSNPFSNRKPSSNGLKMEMLILNISMLLSEEEEESCLFTKSTMSKVIVFTEMIILQGLPALILRRSLLGKTN